MRNKYLDQAVRFLVGGLFIFSGLIKLNDPVGTAIKMEEYFEVFAADFGSFFKVFIPWALEISFLLIILEIALGVGVLIRFRMKVTAWVLLGLTVFFLFLTFYSAAFNKVTDCGCFGDAIKLTPWQSFSKDVVLLVLVLHLFWYRSAWQPALPPRLSALVMIACATGSTYLGLHAIRHLPYLDFRPYRVGKSIPAEMKPEETPRILYEFKKDGATIRSEKYLSKNEGYAYVRSFVANPDKALPKITDYSVTDVDGNDVTDTTFVGPRLLIIIADVGQASTTKIDRITTLVNALNGKISAMVLTASGAPAFEAFRHTYELAAPYYFTDATVLKTIIRSNPGLTLWNDGVVLAKWHYNDTPTADEVMALVHPVSK